MVTYLDHKVLSAYLFLKAYEEEQKDLVHNFINLNFKDLKENYFVYPFFSIISILFPQLKSEQELKKILIFSYPVKDFFDKCNEIYNSSSLELKKQKEILKKELEILEENLRFVSDIKVKEKIDGIMQFKDNQLRDTIYRYNKLLSLSSFFMYKITSKRKFLNKSKIL